MRNFRILKKKIRQNTKNEEVKDFNKTKIHACKDFYFGYCLLRSCVLLLVLSSTVGLHIGWI